VLTEQPALRAVDVELARRCVRGERDAQREFFHAHRHRVHHVLYRMLGTNREIDDLIQEAFVEILRSLPGFRGDSRLATWIDRICVRVAQGHFVERARWRAHVPLLELVALDDPASGPDRRAEAREAARRLYAILDGVEPSHRIAFALHVIDGRPLRDIAHVMGASVVATKLRVWRTRQRVNAAARRDPVLQGWLEEWSGGVP
jgi:RNA polymerase sigma-70 factor (ECF subfamily)